jgi:hypothetical protein
MPETLEDLLSTNHEFLRILPMKVSVFLEQFGRQIEKPDLIDPIPSAL